MPISDPEGRSSLFFDNEAAASPLYLRGTFVHGLVEYAGLAPTPFRGDFFDLGEQSRYAGDWQTAWDEHWLEKGDGRSRSGEPLTVEEMLTLLSRVTDLSLSDPLWEETRQEAAVDVARLCPGPAG